MKPKKNNITINLFLAFTIVAIVCTNAISANLEKELVIRADMDEAMAKGLVELFEAKYPNTKVIMASDMPSAQSYMKSFSEMPNPQADILHTKIEFFSMGNKEVKAKHGIDMFLAYKSPERARLKPTFMDKEGYWAVYLWNPRVIIYWVDAEKKYGPIESLEDLLTWKGTFDYPDPIKSGAGFSFMQTAIQNFGPEKNVPSKDRWMSGYLNPQGGIDYLAKLEKVKQMAHPATSTMIQLFARKELDAHWNFETYYYRYKIERGFDIKAVYPKEGTIITSSAVGIINKCKNINAAKAWVDFVLSKETQEWITKSTYYQTAGLDVKLPEEMVKNALPHSERVNVDIPEELIAEKATQYKEMVKKEVLK
jgi:iron(III) transport system substrate-binding protein